jgi:hypothetical protein
MTTPKKRGICRQGDVLLVPVDTAPTGVIPAPKDVRGIVLAEGETSGHHHQVFGRGAKLFAFRAEGRQERMLHVGRSGAEVRVVGGGSGGVDRHTPVSLKPGAYLVRVQRAWSAEDERASNVCD